MTSGAGGAGTGPARTSRSGSCSWPSDSAGPPHSGHGPSSLYCCGVQASSVDASGNSSHHLQGRGMCLTEGSEEVEFRLFEGRRSRHHEIQLEYSYGPLDGGPQCPMSIKKKR